MNLAIFILVVLVIVALLVWAVGYLPMLQPPISNLIIVVIILAAVVAIAHKAGII